MQGFFPEAHVACVFADWAPAQAGLVLQARMQVG